MTAPNNTDAARVRRWTTNDVPPAQRLDYWVGAISEGFLEMSATSPVTSRFDSSLESAPLGSIGVSQVRGSAQDVFRTRSAIARSRENYFYLLCKTDSSWSSVQDGYANHLLPNDVVLIDSRLCYEFHFPVSADSMSLQLPPSWVESWLVDPARYIARRIDGQAGWGAVLSSFMRQLSPDAVAPPPLPAQLLTDQLGALLALATGSKVPGKAASDAGTTALRGRVLDTIRARHAEPGLTAATVAADVSVSERTLHRSLAGSGQSFGSYLAACRMSVAQRMLRDPRFDRLSVAEVGRRIGLSDASHFVRQCRRHLGGTPGVLRRKRLES
jgi:AraC family transcriptional regulator, positive regulator of tynA and feaB